MSRYKRVSVVGATGLVGRTVVELLERRDFPFEKLTLFASPRSVGEEVFCKGTRYLVEELTKEAFIEKTDLALASAGKPVSTLLKEWVKGTGIVVVDNSSAFRMDPDVPLVVPEINPGAAFAHKGYIANPNCTTIQLVMALKPIADGFGLKRVVVSSYQSVSGAGQKGVNELSEQSIAIFNQRPIEQKVFPRQIAFNAVPQIGPFGSNGYTDEEMKVTHETRKILGLADLNVSCTAVRVPTFSCHAECVMIETERTTSPEELRAALRAFPGVRVVDDPAAGEYPVPLDGIGVDEVLVGRLRQDLSAPNSYLLWLVADNILKGAALNAVQIAELLVRQLQ
jgi:aspartate-semialdehyde dehydrogenase